MNKKQIDQLKAIIKEQVEQVMQEDEKKRSVKKSLMLTWEGLTELYQAYAENDLLEEAAKVREFMNWMEHEIMRHPAKNVTWTDYE